MIGKIAIPVVLLAAGGGGTFGLMSAGVIGGGEPEEQDNSPKLVMKGEDDPFALAGADEDDGGFVYGESGDKYRVAYFSFSEDFVSNLRDSDGLIQVTLAASTKRDGRVLMWLKKHELAIRSQLLVDLADTPEEELETPEGKLKLQQRMVNSINRVLTETEGFGGVDQVYFRSLIIQ